jgi:hypothetical protein
MACLTDDACIQFSYKSNLLIPLSFTKEYSITLDPHQEIPDPLNKTFGWGAVQGGHQTGRKATGCVRRKVAGEQNGKEWGKKKGVAHGTHPFCEI